MPNLQGASPVGHEEGGRSYAAQMVGRWRPSKDVVGRKYQNVVTPAATVWGCKEVAVIRCRQ